MGWLAGFRIPLATGHPDWIRFIGKTDHSCKGNANQFSQSIGLWSPWACRQFCHSLDLHWIEPIVRLGIFLANRSGLGLENDLISGMGRTAGTRRERPSKANGSKGRFGRLTAALSNDKARPCAGLYRFAKASRPLRTGQPADAAHDPRPSMARRSCASATSFKVSTLAGSSRPSGAACPA